MMLSCKEVTRLLSEQQERKLTHLEAMQLRIHLWICKPCQRFKLQVQQLSGLAKQFASGANNDSDAKK